MPSEAAISLPALPQGSLQGREAFRQAVRDAIAHAAAAPAQFSQLIFCDPDFADWPLGERAVADALQVWALRGHGQLLLLASRYDEVHSACTRFSCNGGACGATRSKRAPAAPRTRLTCLACSGRPPGRCAAFLPCIACAWQATRPIAASRCAQNWTNGWAAACLLFRHPCWVCKSLFTICSWARKTRA